MGGRNIFPTERACVERVPASGVLVGVTTVLVNNRPANDTPVSFNVVGLLDFIMTDDDVGSNGPGGDVHENTFLFAIEITVIVAVVVGAIAVGIGVGIRSLDNAITLELYPSDDATKVSAVRCVFVKVVDLGITLCGVNRLFAGSEAVCTGVTLNEPISPSADLEAVCTEVTLNEPISPFAGLEAVCIGVTLRNGSPVPEVLVANSDIAADVWSFVQSITEYCFGTILLRVSDIVVDVAVIVVFGIPLVSEALAVNGDLAAEVTLPDVLRRIKFNGGDIDTIVVVPT